MSIPEELEGFLFFSLVHEYLTKEIHTFGTALMNRFMMWANAAALTFATLWIMQRGYRIISGQSREPIMAVLVGMTRTAVIIAVSTSMAAGGTSLHEWLTEGLDKEIHHLFTGEHDQTTHKSIDRNFALTQFAMSAISAVQVSPGDPEMQSLKDRTALMALIGTAGAPMAAGAMHLLYRFAMALFIGLGPLFILCLLFDQTKDLFKRWLLYGLGTLFSLALLSVVSAIVLKMTVRIGIVFWFNKFLENQFNIGSEGFASHAAQQAGIGMLVTALVVSVPPMAAAFFQGTLGQFMAHATLDRAGGGSPSTNPGNHAAQTASNSATGSTGQPSSLAQQGATEQAGPNMAAQTASRVTNGEASANQNLDVIKSGRSIDSEVPYQGSKVDRNVDESSQSSTSMRSHASTLSARASTTKDPIQRHEDPDRTS